MLSNGLIIIYGIDQSNDFYQTRQITLPIAFTTHLHAAAISGNHSIRTETENRHQDCGLADTMTLKFVRSKSFLAWSYYIVIGI